VKRLSNTGFTLIEVLVALAVFGLMSMLAYSALGSTLSNADFLADRMDRLQSIQRTIRYLSSDLIQAAPRPVRTDLGDSVSPALRTSLSSEFAIELTRGGWGNPAGLPRGTLQRVAYRIEEDELVRYHWFALDRTFANEPVAIVLLDNIESLFFRYYDSNGEPSEVWPPTEIQGGAALRLRPRAVEIVLTLGDQGEIRRLVEVSP
jgi:general secretion pathway protein J